MAHDKDITEFFVAQSEQQDYSFYRIKKETPHKPFYWFFGRYIYDHKFEGTDTKRIFWAEFRRNAFSAISFITIDFVIAIILGAAEYLIFQFLIMWLGKGIAEGVGKLLAKAFGKLWEQLTILMRKTLVVIVLIFLFLTLIVLWQEDMYGDIFGAISEGITDLIEEYENFNSDKEEAN